MTTLVIPAAGQGTRLGGCLPKALTPLLGSPLVQRVVDAAKDRVARIVVVITPSAASQFYLWQQTYCSDIEISWAFQPSPAGSLDAVKIGLTQALKVTPAQEPILISWADQVGISPAVVKTVSDLASGSHWTLVVPSAETSHPYVWLDVKDGLISAVHRVRDGDTPPPIGRADLGIFGLGTELARWLIRTELPELTTSSFNREREIDFTYALPMLSEHADAVELPLISDPSAVIAVNTPEDLQLASEVLDQP